MAGMKKGDGVLKHKRTLTRNEDTAVFGGVCAGIAQYFDMDNILIRVAAVILGFFTLGLALIPYLIMWAVLPSYSAPRDSLVDVNPSDVQSDKYTHVVNSDARSAKQQKVGVFAGAGHVPPRPPLNVKTSPVRKVMQSTPPEDDKKGEQHPVVIAVVLGVLLFALFIMFADNMVGRWPDLELIQFIPIVFVVLGLVVLVAPFHRWSLLVRFCGFILCVELCLCFLAFTILDIPLDMFGKMSPVSNLMWVGALFTFIAALVCKEDTLFVVTVVLTFLACMCSLGEVHITAYLFDQSPYSHHNFIFPPMGGA